MSDGSILYADVPRFLHPGVRQVEDVIMQTDNASACCRPLPAMIEMQDADASCDPCEQVLRILGCLLQEGLNRSGARKYG